MKTAVFGIAAVFTLFTFAIDSVSAQEASSANLIILPSQERIPQTEQPVLPPELFIPPIGAAPPPPSERRVDQNFSPFRAPLINSLERGKWYVQIGAYTRPDHVEDAISRVGSTSPVVIQNVGTDINPMFRVLLGPFSRNESKTTLQRFRNKGYDAFERNG